MLQAHVARRALSVAVSLIFLASVMPLAGIAAAAAPSTTCSPNEGPGATCYLDISAPSSVRTGTAFIVQVRVTTDFTKATVAKSDPCGSKARIELDVLADESPTATYIATAKGGIATFSITVANAETYSLVASSPPGESSPPAGCEAYAYESDSSSLRGVDVAPVARWPPSARYELRAGDERQRHAGDPHRRHRVGLDGRSVHQRDPDR